MKQTRKCEVAFPYSPMNKDELELVVGETIEIIKEVDSLLITAQTFTFELKKPNSDALQTRYGSLLLPVSKLFACCLLKLLGSQTLSTVCKSGSW